MGLEKVKEDVKKEAKEEAEKIHKEKQKKKEEILEEARKEAEKIRERTEKEIMEQKDSLEKTKLSNARMKAKEVKLEAKQEKIDEAFEHIGQRIRNMSDDEKAQFVENAISEAAFDVGQIKASESFEKGVSEKGYNPEGIDKVGIILISKNGERRQSYTLERITQDFRDKNRKELMEVLFS